MTSKNKKLTVLFVIGCICILVIAGAVGLVAGGAFKNRNKIAEGVKISGLDVGGLTKEEAQKKADTYIEKLENREVTIVIDDAQQITTTAKNLGFSCEAGDTVDKAYALGKSNGLLSGFHKITEKEKNKLSFTTEVDEEMVKMFVQENCKKYDITAKNAKLKLVNGAFKATKSRDGREIKVEDTATVISHDLLKKVSDEPLEIDAVVQVKKAKYTKEQVAKCKDLLGSYSTSYATSTAARATNVKVAANYINGTIVYPGKTFSVIKTIKDRTEENGYQAASEYSSGKVVEGIGGGVCQVSTTLYNAVINAELEVVERSPHSMVVSYVDVSRDAAISGDYKDFKFKNNTDVPVYIAATADGVTLSFRIYGEETRPANRTIKFKPEILETIEPGEAKVTEDKTKPASYRTVTQSAHVGYKAKLWKIVYVDGQRTDKILLNSSVYAAEPEYVTVGKQPKETKEPKNTEKPKTSANPKETKSPKASAKSTVKPKATKKPVATSKPKATKKPAAE
ncbi:MAG: VanW family protein [Butyribacter sp.]|nr:VanW family protein [bacterium]MDY3854087.1 VanW family protein [Butyribacter sp.]